MRVCSLSFILLHHNINTKIVVNRANVSAQRPQQRVYGSIPSCSSLSRVRARRYAMRKTRLGTLWPRTGARRSSRRLTRATVNCGEARRPLPSPRALGLSPQSDYIFGAKSCGVFGPSAINCLDADLDVMCMELILICSPFGDLQIR